MNPERAGNCPELQGVSIFLSCSLFSVAHSVSDSKDVLPSADRFRARAASRLDDGSKDDDLPPPQTTPFLSKSFAGGEFWRDHGDLRALSLKTGEPGRRAGMVGQGPARSDLAHHPGLADARGRGPHR
jgi:hypothetical protein